MVAASLYGLFALSAGVSIPMLFLIMALMNAAIVLFTFKRVPEFIMRLMIWLLIHSIYRVDKIPNTGPAVLVCNHVSFVDALILAGNINVRFDLLCITKYFRYPCYRLY